MRFHLQNNVPLRGFSAEQGIGGVNKIGASDLFDKKFCSEIDWNKVRKLPFSTKIGGVKHMHCLWLHVWFVTQICKQRQLS